MCIILFREHLKKELVFIANWCINQRSKQSSKYCLQNYTYSEKWIVLVCFSVSPGCNVLLHRQKCLLIWFMCSLYWNQLYTELSSCNNFKNEVHNLTFFNVAEAVFKTTQLYMWGLIFSQLKHVKFGRVHGMSTRQGKVVLLRTLLQEAKHRMLESMKNSPSNVLFLK